GDDFSSGNNFSDFWEYDFSTDTWIQIEDFQGTARRYLSATTLNNVAYAGLGTNGTNFKDFWVFDPVLSVIEKSLEDFEILVYPNPAASYCSIQIPEEILHHPVQLQIRDLNGTVVYTEQLYSKDQQFNLMDLVNGIYFIEITYNDSILKTSKFVKLNA
ncbi:MAG: T9SS type A sorting domain-containing protein, partial [Bacteroidetes bacterium]